MSRCINLWPNLLISSGEMALSGAVALCCSKKLMILRILIAIIAGTGETGTINVVLVIPLKDTETVKTGIGSGFNGHQDHLML